MSEAIELVTALCTTDPDDNYQVAMRVMKVYDDFKAWRNPAYPQQSLLQYLTDYLAQHNRPIALRNIALALLALFCEPSKDYDESIIKHRLIELGLAEVLFEILWKADCATIFAMEDSKLQQQHVEELERSSGLLLTCAGLLLPAKTEFVAEKLVKLLVELCIPEPKTRGGRLFGYSHKARERMIFFIGGKTVVALKTEGSESNGAALFESCFGYRKVCLESWRVDITMQGVDDSVQSPSLSDVLVSSSSVWPSRRKLPRPEVAPGTSEASGSCCEPVQVMHYLHVGDIIRPPHFLARVIELSTKQSKLEVINDILRSSSHASLPQPPKTGDMVTFLGPNFDDNQAKDCGTSKHKFSRGQVLQQATCGAYEVLAIDYGRICLVKIEQIFSQCKELDFVKPDAVLCTLQGVGSAPLSNVIVANAIDVLRVLSKGRTDFGRRIVTSSLPMKLLRLLDCCPVQDLCLKVVSLLGDLARDGHLRPYMRSLLCRTMAGDMNLFGLCKKFVRKGWMKVTLCILITITNLVITSGSFTAQKNERPSATSKKSDMEVNSMVDLEFLLRLIAVPSKEERAETVTARDEVVRSAALRCLRNFLGDVCTAEHGPEPAVPTQARFVALSDGIGSTKSPCALQSTLSTSCVQSGHVAADEPLHGSSSSPGLNSARLPGSATARNGRGSMDGKLMVFSPPEDAVHIDGDCNAVAHHEVMVIGGREVSEDRTAATYYVSGSLFDQVDDERHELYNETGLTDLATSYLEMHMCGFLNSGKGGEVIYGVKRRTVYGIDADRKTRDDFRLRFDSLVTAFTPKLFHTMVDLKFHPVVISAGSNSDCTRVPIPDKFVIRVLIEPTRCRTLYFLPRYGGRTWVRKGGVTSEAIPQDVREMAIACAEQEFLAGVPDLQ